MSDLFKDLFASQKCQRGPCGDTIVTWMVTLGPDPKACWAHYTDAERIALNAARTELNDRMDRLAVEPDCWSWPTPEHREYASEEEARSALDEWQRGRGCAICGPPAWNLVNDHDHQTGLLRGKLCGPCNIKEGWGNETPPFIKYRERGPAVILGVKVRYWSSFTGYAEPVAELSPAEEKEQRAACKAAVERRSSQLPSIEDLRAASDRLSLPAVDGFQVREDVT